MKRNRITIFNRLTSQSSLADVSAFEEMVGLHYEKFCYLYAVISRNNFIDCINDVNCKLGKNKVAFTIVLNQNRTRLIEKQLESNIEAIEYEMDDNSPKICWGEDGKKIIILSIEE